MSDDDATRGPAPTTGDPEWEAKWDRRYAEQERMWSGRPNGALVAETAGLTPGRALDVGCGEGADAVWLARRGWDVTGLEVSGVALERAAAHAAEAGVTVTWAHASLTDADLAPASFDLVYAMYPAVRRTPDSAPERALLSLVAPGGTLLFVHHAGMHDGPGHEDEHAHDAHDREHNHDHGHDHGHDGSGGENEFDPADFVWPWMVAAALVDDWQVEVDEQRQREVPESGAGAGHADDLVLRARRLR